MPKQRKKKKSQENEKENLRDTGRGECNPRKAEDRRKNCHKKEPKCPPQHFDLLNFRSENLPVAGIGLPRSFLPGDFAVIL
jgi:hypothetical protein